MHRITILIVICLVILAGCQPATVIVEPTKTGWIGTISRISDVVEKGESANHLTPIAETSNLKPGDVLKLSSGGEGLLDFGDFLEIRVFNDTRIKSVTLERAENLPLFARIQLEMGGFTGKLRDEGGQAIFETPNGAKITILGTRFWIIYNPDTQVLGVGNFEGHTLLDIQNISLAISNNHYVIVHPGQPPEPERPMAMSQAQLEDEFRVKGSPVDVLVTELDIASTLTPTLSPTPTAPPETTTVTTTPSPSPSLTLSLVPTDTPSPTPACPPKLRLNKDANCRAGPGQNWKIVTSFTTGTTLNPKGFATFRTLWWYVAIPNSGASCWVSDSTVDVLGDASCMQTYQIPPTYTPIPPTFTPTPPPPVFTTSAPPPVLTPTY